MINVTAEAFLGEQINNCISQAIHICQHLQGTSEDLPDSDAFHDLTTTGELDDEGVDMTVEFNGVTVTVKADSDPELIYRDWSRALSGYIDKNVGPYPNPALTDEEKESDARIKAENDQRWAEKKAELDAKDEARRVSTEAKLADAPPMKVADEALWQSCKDNNPEGYGAAINVYAERWARLMQVEMAVGKTLEEVAETTSHEADLEGISGYQYGAAVHTLAGCWTHGDELRKWHNKLYGVGEDVKGTVNPAVITVGCAD